MLLNQLFAVSFEHTKDLVFCNIAVVPLDMTINFSDNLEHHIFIGVTRLNRSISCIIRAANE